MTFQFSPLYGHDVSCPYITGESQMSTEPSLLGEPRATADIDSVIVLSVDALPQLMAITKEAGLLPRIADAEMFARRNRVLLLNHRDSGIDVDISLVQCQVSFVCLPLEGDCQIPGRCRGFGNPLRAILNRQNFVDTALGLLPFEIEAAERGQMYQTGTLEVRLPTPEDLIIQKAIAHRPKDMLDIAAIIANHPKLDWQRIAFWLQQFADLLEMPEIWQDIAKMHPKTK